MSHEVVVFLYISILTTRVMNDEACADLSVIIEYCR